MMELDVVGPSERGPSLQQEAPQGGWPHCTSNVNPIALFLDCCDGAEGIGA